MAPTTDKRRQGTDLSTVYCCTTGTRPLETHRRGRHRAQHSRGEYCRTAVGGVFIRLHLHYNTAHHQRCVSYTAALYTSIRYQYNMIHVSKDLFGILAGVLSLIFSFSVALLMLLYTSTRDNNSYEYSSSSSSSSGIVLACNECRNPSVTKRCIQVYHSTVYDT